MGRIAKLFFCFFYFLPFFVPIFIVLKEHNIYNGFAVMGLGVPLTFTLVMSTFLQGFKNERLNNIGCMCLIVGHYIFYWTVWTFALYKNIEPAYVSCPIAFCMALVGAALLIRYDNYGKRENRIEGATQSPGSI